MGDVVNRRGFNWMVEEAEVSGISLGVPVVSKLIIYLKASMTCHVDDIIPSDLQILNQTFSVCQPNILIDFISDLANKQVMMFH